MKIFKNEKVIRDFPVIVEYFRKQKHFSEVISLYMGINAKNTKHKYKKN